MSINTQSPDPDIDTLKCPKCGTIWHAKGNYDYDLGGWNYFGEDGNNEGLCPSRCKNILGAHITGKEIKRL